MGWIGGGQDRRRVAGAGKAMDGNPLRRGAGLLIVGARNGKRTSMPNMVGWAPGAPGGGMSLWAFRFLLWYICILLVQPQNRFTFLWPLRIANLSFIIAVCLHVMGCLESRRFLIRLGPGTILAFLLLLFATLSQHFGVYQISSAWNPRRWTPRCNDYGRV